MTKFTFHGIVHRDIQEVCGSSRILISSSAEVCQGALGHSYSFLPDSQHLSGVEKSAFTDILSKAAWSHT